MLKNHLLIQSKPYIDGPEKILPVIELYPCLQGEGKRRGIPTLTIRTTGCTHRCYFQGDNWCDSWYSSIHAEKGCYTFENIIDFILKHKAIKEIMLTGGSPTMHPKLVSALTVIANELKLLITLETEGSHFVKTPYPIGLLSLSPKFSNTIPSINQKTPHGKLVTEAMVKQHNKYRLNFKAIKEMINYHDDYQIKPVFDGKEQTLKEILAFCEQLSIPADKVYLMPQGQTREQMLRNYSKTMSIALENGFSFTGRDHIIAYNDKRYV
ncbi:7-carboxy-7-deazaguanine synthase QueE [Thiotrichales bacterium 19S9-12]|nr:7-carboxy-7-deazaguanine synthase QueE [Thiotrichales bacterium 19S9-11]MCF6810771.1 7-carboxy-7-deazaguanine synthase QueE [Thiotrichales bacterium 19S9-12]